MNYGAPTSGSNTVVESGIGRAMSRLNNLTQRLEKSVIGTEKRFGSVLGPFPPCAPCDPKTPSGNCALEISLGELSSRVGIALDKLDTVLQACQLP